MRIKMKRFLGILLSLVMVLGLVPGISMMANAQTTVDYQSFFVDGINGAQNFDVVSGTGGVNVTSDTTNTRGVTWDAQESCAVFDGEAYLVINNPLKNANASTGFTITMEAYISSDNNSSGKYIDNRGNTASKNGWQRLFDLSDGTKQKYLYINAGSAGHLRYAVATKSNSNQQGRTPGGSYYNAWHTYTLVVKPGGDMALYVDGTQISSMESNDTIKDALNLLSSFNTCYIGSSVYETTKQASDGFFIGKIRGFSTVNASDVFTLTFNSNGGAEEFKSVATPIIPDNLPRPTKENYAFEGWYMDSELTQQATSGTKLTKDTTLYAKWTPNYTVTYKVVGGTWLDGSTADKTETVKSGSKPTSVPTGMKPDGGYTGGAWNTDPAEAAITGATTFTYTFTVKQAATVKKVPTAKTLTYNGSAQELVTAGEATGGEMQYALGADATTAPTEGWGTSIPAKTNAGTYYVWYKVFGDDDHNDSKAECIPVTIAKKTDLTDVSAAQKENETLVYDGTSKTPTIIVKDKDTSLTDGDDYTVKYVGVAPTVYEESETAPASVGNYKAVITFKGNYDGSKNVEFTISKAAAPTLTDGQKPVAVTELEYDGASHGLVTSPTDDIPEGYTLKYSTDNGTTWTTEIPTGTNAGDYTVKVKYVADKNHTDIEGADINVKIAKQSQEAPAVPVTTKASSAEASDGKVSPVDTTMEYSTDGETWTAITADAEGKAMLPAGEYSLRKKGDNNHDPSDTVPFTIGVKEEQTAPDKADITVTNASDKNVSDGKITGVDDTMEYSSDKDKIWKNVDAGKTVIDNLPEGDYEIRKRGDEDHNPSDSVKVTIGVTSRTQGVVNFDNTRTSETGAAVATIVSNAESSNIKEIAAGQMEVGKDVKVELEITPQEEKEVVKDSVTKINDTVKEVFAGIETGNIVTEYLKIDLTKYVDNAEEGKIPDTKTPLEIELTYDKSKTGNPIIIRTHNGVAKAFEKLASRPGSGFRDGTYHVADGRIYLYSQYFSDFAIVYATEKTYYVNIDLGNGESIQKIVGEDDGIELPANISKDGFSFGGLYKDAEYKDAWNNAADKVKEDTTLYAKWNKSVTGVTVDKDNVSFTTAGETSQITVNVLPADADNKKVTFASSDPNVASVDVNGLITAVASGTADIIVTTEDGAKTATIKVTVEIPEIAKQGVTEPTKEEKAVISMNAGLKISQTGSKINIKWGKVAEADGYDVYVTYCGESFAHKKPAKTINKNTTVSANITKINGKKINLKKNFKLYVAAYKMVDGNKEILAKSITGHVVGRLNTKYSNAKNIKITSKTKVSIKVGKTSKIKAKTVLVEKGKKQLSNAHAKEFRYASSNNSIATVDAKGKIKAVSSGTCTIYVYSRNGYAKKVSVMVK